MKKFTFLMMLLLGSMAWNVSMAQGVWSYDENDPLIINADDDDPNCQFSSDFKAGEHGTTAEGSYRELIDGNEATFFITGWSATPSDCGLTDDHPHWLQVDLQDRPQSKIIFVMMKRVGSNPEAGQNNRPSAMTLTVSNDLETWKEVKVYNDGDLPTDNNIVSYTSEMIDFGETYRYIRFNVTRMASGGTNGNYPYVNIADLQVYEAVQREDDVTKLKVRADELYTTINTFAVGTDPGYYPAEAIADLNDLFTKAFDIVDSENEAAAAAMLEELEAGYQKALDSEIKPGDAYFYIVNAYTAYSSTKALYADADGGLYWADFDPTQAKFAWHIRPLGDDKYSIQNAATKQYINTELDAAGNFTDATDTQVFLSDEHQTDQYFVRVMPGQFNIFNVRNSRPLHTQGHSDGAGVEGFIATWTSSGNGNSAWYLQTITDEDLIKSFEENGMSQIYAEALQKAYNEVYPIRDKANDYTKLITSVDQISSNNQSEGDGSAYSYLIDGSASTIFHSLWDASFSGILSEGTGWHNLQFDLGKEVQNIKFSFIGRDNSDGWHDNPTILTIYATNDEEAAALTTDNLGRPKNFGQADSTLWTEITTLTREVDGLPGNDNAVRYTSKNIDLGEPYKYVRFVVKEISTRMSGGNRASAFGSPDVSGLTFNFAEFQVYDATPTETSEYYTVPGMKEACDVLDAQMTAALEKIANKTATLADAASLREAAAKVNAIYVDRAALDTELANLVKEAEQLHFVVADGRERLVTEVSQISSNSLETGESTGYAGLIDNNTDTYFHSYWNTAMANAEITADEWIATMEADEDASCVFNGTGYHNLQIKLNNPVDEFHFSYTGRNNATWHDNPNDIIVYVTNDDELGASTLASESSAWTKIAELNENFPENVGLAQYTSPNLDLGGSYKYIRLEVRGTTNMNVEGIDRTVLNPDVTGVVFCLSELQLYKGLLPEQLEYNYVEGMKDVADNLAALIAADKAQPALSMVTRDKINELQAAIDAVRALHADTTELVRTYRQYMESTSSYDIGDHLGGVDSQESLDKFIADATAARYSVDAMQPTAAEINQALADLKAAYETFLTHVQLIDPTKWYNITSNSTREYATDRPIFLGSTSTGSLLYLGNDYPFDQMPVDPYATWRFVPVEGAINQYYIQSMGTGQYWGAYRGQGSGNAPLLSHEKAAYTMKFVGGGQFKLQQVGVADPEDNIKADQSNNIILNWPSNGDQQQQFSVQEIDLSQELMEIRYFPANTIQVLTLPFESKGDFTLMAISGFMKASDPNTADVTTYGIKYLKEGDGENELGLKIQEEFEAGEPVIIVVGDPANYNADEQATLYTPIPETVVDESTIVTNGLHGTLTGTSVQAGMGIFTSGKLSATTGSVSLAGRDGWINPAEITNEDGEADLVLSTTLTGVKGIKVLNPAEKVNVYTIDGKLVKKNVKATEAKKNLGKGIYIIGREKVAVK